MSFTIFQKEKTPFQAIKTRSSKSRKIDFFSIGLTHGCGQIFSIFPSFFQAKQARKMCFTLFQNEKKPFQALKTRSSKSRKIDIFPKGLTHGFSPKMAIFPTFIFQAIQTRKMFYDFLERKNAFLGYKNKKSKKLKNRYIFKGVNPWFWSKNGHFSNFLCFGNLFQENVFYDILERKNAFLGYKNKKFKKS